MIFYGCTGYAASHWEYPLNADVEYQSNLTAILGTSNPAQEQGYLNNIQDLNAQYLPMIMVAYPDFVAAYNTQHWTNWAPLSDSVWPGIPNSTMLATVQPVGATTSGSSPTTSIATSTSSSIATRTSTSGLSSGTIALIAGVVIVVVVIAGVATYMLRRKPPPAKP